MNIVSTTVSVAIMGTLMPGVMMMSIAPTVASVRAKNFAEAELKAVTFAAESESNNQLATVPNNCFITDKGNNIYEISCTEGSGTTYVQTVSRSLRLNILGNGLSANSDNDSDGFDDVTGLPTHYWECYSGWKGEGSLKNNCDLGGEYVIPAYAHLYE